MTTTTTLADYRTHRAAQRLQRAVAGSQLPPRYIRAGRLAELTPLAHQAEAVRALRTWVEGEQTANLLICGPTGSGKTHLASALLLELLHTGSEARWVTQRSYRGTLEQLFTASRRRDGVGMAAASLVLDRLQDLSCVLFDDIDAEALQEWAQQRTAALIGDRYLSLRPTIITTNSSAPTIMDDGRPDPRGKLCRRLGQRALERLLEDCEVIELTGATQRRKGRR